MAERANEPGPGRSTADAALKAAKEEIAERNERAREVARKQDAPRDRAMLERKRRLEAM
jgi:hypothetical protein